MPYAAQIRVLGRYTMCRYAVKVCIYKSLSSDTAVVEADVDTLFVICVGNIIFIQTFLHI